MQIISQRQGADEKGETVKEPYKTAEILRKQYESTFSTPNNVSRKEGVEEELTDTSVEDVNKTHEDEEDNSHEKDMDKMNENNEDSNSHEQHQDQQGPQDEQDPPEIYDVPFDDMDIVEAINQLS